MKIGDETVYTLVEAAAELGLNRRTLYLQVKRGKLHATLKGRAYLVLASEVARYRREVQGKPGFAAETHPYHGRRPPRKGDAAPSLSKGDSGGAPIPPVRRDGDHGTE